MEQPAGAPALSPPPEETPRASLWARWRQRRGWRIATTGAATVLVALSVYYIAAKLVPNVPQILALRAQLRLGPVVGSLVLTLLCGLLGGPIWYLVLRGVGGRLALRECTRAHLLANLGGYLPGYGWKHLGKALLAQRQGVPLARASSAVLIEFAGLALTRAVVALSSISVATLEAWGMAGVGPYLGALRGAAWLALLGAPWLLERGVAWLARRRPPRGGSLAIRKGALWGAMALMCATWVLFGLGLAVLLEAVQSLSGAQFLVAIFATTTSFLASLLVFFVPAGIGVRESVLILALGNALPEATVTAGTLLSRVILILAEIGGALIGLAMGWRRRDQGQ
jgi:uncharacterized membrane protein YbhN (UPF0104 family)